MRSKENSDTNAGVDIPVSFHYRTRAPAHIESVDGRRPPTECDMHPYLVFITVLATWFWLGVIAAWSVRDVTEITWKDEEWN